MSLINVRDTHETLPGGIAAAHPEQSHDLTLIYERRSYQVAKRLFDITSSLILLIVLFPVFVAVTIAVLIACGGPAVFKQTRIGLNGRTFKIYKFRTMVKDAEKILQSRPDLLEEYRLTYKIQNDPRITKVGRFLRKTSLDELPQLFNVLCGEMSLVGPRPIVPRELEMYGDSADVYLALKPGCAGLWQCSGRSDLSYAERVALDVAYYKRASIGFDLRIIGQTFVAVLQRKGAN